MTFKLWDSQQRVVDDVISCLKAGHKRILVVSPTGTGKTAISTDLARRCIAKDNSLFFICHRRELITQTHKTYIKNSINPAFIQSGKKADYDNMAQIASVKTLVRRLDLYPHPVVIFWDECHHIAAGEWDQIFKMYPNAIHIGLTATPVRLDGKPLKAYFDIMVEANDVAWHIENGLLVPYKYFAVSELDYSGMKSNKGEYTKKSQEALDPTNKIVGDNIEHYKKFCNGKRNIIFARNVKHSMEIVKRYNEAGIPARHLDGTTPTGERNKVLTMYENGEILVLSNVDLFGEGFDLPAIEAVSLLRKTKSLTTFLQQVGRSLRTCTEIGKIEAIILDHVGNYIDHGFPDDKREWSLEIGIVKKKNSKEDDSLIIKRCPECKFAHRVSLVCPNCGYEYRANGKDIKEIAGSLVLVGSKEYDTLLNKQLREVKTFECS